MYSKFFKRFADVVFSLIILAVFGIFMALIAIAIKIDSKGPVISDNSVSEKTAGSSLFTNSGQCASELKIRAAACILIKMTKE